MAHCTNRVLNWLHISLNSVSKIKHISCVTTFFAVPQSDRFNFKSLKEYEVFVNIRWHCFVIETWEQFRRPRSTNLGNWKKCMSINLRGFRDIHNVHIHTINISTKYALNKLQLMKNIQIQHVSSQGAILREFLKKNPEKGTSVSRL
jgi:hypothetical protein